MPVNFGGFAQCQITDSTGSFIDVSTYCTRLPTPLTFGLVDLTTFIGTGLPSTVKQIHGAVDSKFQMTMLLDPVVHLLMAQWLANRNGNIIRLNLGKNALAGQGDAYFAGTFTLFTITANIATNNRPADATLDWAPSDVGSTGVSPGWYRI